MKQTMVRALLNTSEDVPMPMHDMHGDITVNCLDAGLPQLADNPISEPQQHFVLNQSVRALVASVDLERGRFALVLKHSMTGAADGLYAESLFESQETAEKLRCDSWPHCLSQC